MKNKLFFGVLLSCLLQQALAQSDIPRANFWVTDGSVEAMALEGNTLYIGGNFSYVGPNLPYGLAIDNATGLPNTAFVKPNGALRTCVPDGSGGWYIGGDFTMVGGVVRNHIARINADGSLHSWNPNANNMVNTLAVSGSKVYVGGSFTTIGGQTRNYIAALDATTGNAITTWHPNANNHVTSFALSSSTMYARGYFTSIGGQTRNNIAALDISTGLPTTWDPNANGWVKTLAVNGTALYAGGSFTSIGTESRSSLAAFSDLSTLPVSLTQFNAIISGSQAQLSWSTASEQNNKGFHIQRSANGRDYANIGFVTASGNGSGANYSYTDAAPLNGRNLFRLQQVDTDGKTSMSQVRELSFIASNLRIYPNPVKTTLTLMVPATNEPLQLRLTDLRGSVLKSWNYRQTPPTLQLGLEHLPAGIYLLEVWQGL